MSPSHDTYLPTKNPVRMFYIFIFICMDTIEIDVAGVFGEVI